MDAQLHGSQITLSIAPEMVLDETHQREAERIVNVASVPMRSPFRYPGGKTWLIPRIRKWLRGQNHPHTLIEPFAGGAIVSLTAIFENLVDEAILVELDEDVGAVWHTILNGDGGWLAERIAGFELSADAVQAALACRENSIRDRAFATLLRNRISRGGILAPGAGIVKKGENGRGLASRWYPQTLRRRLLEVVACGDRLKFILGDGVSFLRENSARSDAVYFIDPPYTVAGRRLYMHSDIDHAGLFEIAEGLKGDFLMTYDSTQEIWELAKRHGFAVREVQMKNTHHARKTELLISRDLGWLDE